MFNAPVMKAYINEIMQNVKKNLTQPYRNYTISLKPKPRWRSSKTGQRADVPKMQVQDLHAILIKVINT